MNKYTIIPLSKSGKYAGKYEAIVSLEDTDLATLNWYARICPHTQYAARWDKSGIGKKEIHLHRIILERVLCRRLTSNEDVDHIDSNGLNNQRENLRIATRSQNAHNRKKPSNNTSGVKGIFFRNDIKRWYAYISINKKRIHLGSFPTKDEAIKARHDAVILYHGDFGRLK